MGLKDIINTMKHEGYVLKRLDQYLILQSSKDDDRRWDINSPSMASQCARAIYYSRTGTDRALIDARTQRIFDNGTHVHIRLQEYMEDEGILLMDEVPVFNLEYQIQGHTDGILALTKFELGVLEIKSINTNQFSSLIDAKEEHKVQAHIYMSCLEEERQRIQAKCKTKQDLNKYIKSKEFSDFYGSLYQHLKGGSKYTREDKINFKIQQHKQVCRLLWNTRKPIRKMVFIYEDKNNQEIKEFVVKWNDKLMQPVKDKLAFVNASLKKKKLPPKEGTSKSCNVCRFCNFKNECWIL